MQCKAITSACVPSKYLEDLTPNKHELHTFLHIALINAPIVLHHLTTCQ